MTYHSPEKLPENSKPRISASHTSTVPKLQLHKMLNRKKWSLSDIKEKPLHIVIFMIK